MPTAGAFRRREVEHYTLADVQGFYRTNFGAQRARIYVVGRFDAASAGYTYSPFSQVSTRYHDATGPRTRTSPRGDGIGNRKPETGEHQPQDIPDEPHN
jgi:hypothetical protein